MHPVKQLTPEEVKWEFEESLGFIRNDIRWLMEKSGPNYTIALLIAVGCEALAACIGGKQRKGQAVFEDLLPAGAWRELSALLYNAFRNGLAHGFDTKHLSVGGREHQIHLNAFEDEFKIVATYNEYAITEAGEKRKFRMASFTKNSKNEIGLQIGMRKMAEALCAKIDEFEVLLATDKSACDRFMAAHQPVAKLGPKEEAAWHSLVKAAGF